LHESERLMPDTRKELEEFLQQLERLPGGPAAAVPDFFGPQLAPDPAATAPDSFRLKDGGTLRLEPDGRLVHDAADADQLIVQLSPEQLDAIHALATPAMPLLPLTLVAIALGAVDDGRRLKKALPRVDGAARDLMLMTVCRLCG
jgi:hypothetical protein